MENPAGINAGAECPFCFEQMSLERRERSMWLVCPNGCPTETEVAPRKPPTVEVPLARAHKAGAS